MTKHKAASEDALNELHAALTQSLTSQITAGDAAPALLSVARQFLKDSGIEATRDNEDMGKLRDSLPSFDDDPDDEESFFETPKQRTL